jgi:hypothetical protein
MLFDPDDIENVTRARAPSRLKLVEPDQVGNIAGVEDDALIARGRVRRRNHEGKALPRSF